MSSTDEKMDALIGMVARLEKKVDRLQCKDSKWVTKSRAMELLDCGKTKLQELVLAGKVQVNANPKKGRELQYELKSIMDYLDNPN